MGESTSQGLMDICCGSLAGATGKVFEYPFDTIKVRLQSQPEGKPLLYKGPIDCLRHSLRNGGLLGLYRGISPPIVGAAAENATLFLFYNASIGFFEACFGPNTSSAALSAGALSGVAASYVLTPIELVKCRIQVQDVPGLGSRRQTVSQVIKAVIQQDGLRGFWRGQTGTLLREAGGSSAWFGAYDYVGRTLVAFRLGSSPNSGSNPEDIDSSKTLPEALIAGACAGVSYNLSLFPADTIKSIMQTQPHGAVTRDFWQTGKSIYKSGGISALYRGCGITLARSAPSSALIFFVYETLKKAVLSLETTGKTTTLA